MFCQQCGKPVEPTAQFCGNCGARTLLTRQPVAPALVSPEISDAVAKQTLASHIRVMGILWAIYSGFRIVMAIWTIVFSRVLMPNLIDQISKSVAQQNDNAPNFAPAMQSLVHMMSGFYLLSAAISILAGALGFWAAWALLKHESSGRTLALVVACVSLISIPFGTGLGVYTLVILLPNKADRLYQEIASSPA